MAKEKDIGDVEGAESKTPQQGGTADKLRFLSMQHTQGDAAQNKADKEHVDDLERAANNVGVLR